MTQYRIGDGGIFTLDSVSDVTIPVADQEHLNFGGAYHIYKFHVRAKILPAAGTSQIQNPKATVVYNGTHTQDMQREAVGSDFFKTINKFELPSPTPITTAITAKVTADIITTENHEDSVSVVLQQ